MLSLFPQLLFLTPVGIALIRLAAGVSYLYLGYHYWTARDRVANERFPMVGTLPVWVVLVGGALSAAVGILLTIGLWTQAAALLGALGAIKGLVLGKRDPEAFPYSRSTHLLLLVMCLSLIVMGAGTFAFDLPL